MNHCLDDGVTLLTLDMRHHAEVEKAELARGHSRFPHEGHERIRFLAFDEVSIVLKYHEFATVKPHPFD